MNKSSQQNIECPICSSTNINESIEDREFSLPLSSNFSIHWVVNKCEECGEEGDFSKCNDLAYEEGEKKAITQSINMMLEDLSEMGITMAHIERVLRLPKRTIARWKNGSDSATGIALLRLVRSCPWLLTIAGNDFSEKTIVRTIIQQSAEYHIHSYLRTSAGVVK